MTIRTDVLIEWEVSPRVITIAAPSTEVTIQDLVDTCRYNEQLLQNIDNDHLIDAAGKEFLGGTTYVGITATLQNAVLAFEARSGPSWILCTIAGGNLVAVDADGLVIDPRLPTAYTTIDRTASASATLQEQDALQYSSYGDKVTLDSLSGYSGSDYPVGTPQMPVDNMADALLIADAKGFTRILIKQDTTLDDSFDLDGFTIEGVTGEVILTIESIASVNNLTLLNLTLVDSTLDGGVDVRGCVVRDVEYVNGHMHNCGLAGTITLGGNRKSVIADSYTVDQDNPPTIDMGTSGNDLAMPNYSGIVSFTNMTDASNELGLGLDAGMAILASTITAGTVIVSGIGLLQNNSGASAVVNTDGLMNKALISEATWDAISHHVHYDAGSGNSGTTFPMGTAEYPLNNLADVVSVCEARGKHGIVFLGTMVVDQDLIGYTITGSTSLMNDVVVIAGVDVSRTRFEECTLTGTAVNSSTMQSFNGLLSNFNGWDGIIISGGMDGVVQVKAGGTLIAKSIAFAGATNEIDANGAIFVAVDFVGLMTLTNLTGGGYFQAGGYFGKVVLDPSCNGGVGRVYGTLEVVDNSTNFTWIEKGYINYETIDQAVWERSNGAQALTDLELIKNVEGGRWRIVSNQMIFYEDDNTTEVARFNLFDSAGSPTMTNVYDRQRV